MFCPNCGSSVPNEMKPCPECGTKLMDEQKAPHSLTYDELMGYHQKVREEQQHDAMLEQAKIRRFAAEAELKRLKAQFLGCLVIGVLLGLVLAITAMSQTSAETLSHAGMDAAQGFLIVFAFSAAIPFGFIPILNHAHKENYSTILSLLLFILFFAFILVFAYFAGIPCFFLQLFRIRRARQEFTSANKQFDELERTTQ